VALRALAGLAGVCGIVAPLYFPIAAFLLGVLALAVWALASRAREPQTAPEQPSLV
jgi:ABC-type Na+ efflux pump permease subunit